MTKPLLSPIFVLHMESALQIYLVVLGFIKKIIKLKQMKYSRLVVTILVGINFTAHNN